MPEIETKVGEQVKTGDVLVILESMKMEMPVEAPEDGKVAEIRCKESQPVNEGDVLVVLK
jgi:acetyl-CoA carboxylase biotin carboxyl carrier protein